MSVSPLPRLPSRRRLIGARDVGRVALLVGLVTTLPRCSALSPDCSATATCTSGDHPDAGKTVGTGGGQSSSSGGGAQSESGGAPVTETGGSAAGGASNGGTTGGGTSAGGSATGGSVSSGATSGAGGASTTVPDGGNAGSTPDSGVPSCATGTADCDRSASNGCETTLATDADHCGACSTSCSSVGAATRACQTGICKLTCDQQHRDCDTDVSTGCEAVIATDVANCGGCGKVCKTDGTTAVACVDGVCKPTCDANHADCDQNGANGCELEIDDDVANCGACGHVCSTTGTSARVCSAGACKPTCAATLGDCSTPKSPATDDGCETDLTAPTTCGACGHDCLGGACTGEKCQPYVLSHDVDQFLMANNYVYYVLDGQGIRWNSLTDKTGGTLSDAGGISMIATDTNYVFWIDDTVVNGQSVQLVERSPSGSSASAAFPGVPLSGTNLDSSDGTNIYWFDKSNIVHQTNEATGSDVAISTALTDRGNLVSDGKHVFVTQGSDIVSIPVGGGAFATEPVPGLFFGSAIDASNIYFWTEGTDSTFNVSWLPKSLVGTPKSIPTDITSRAAASNVWAAGGYVYFAQKNGIYRTTTTPGAVPQQVLQNTNGIVTIGATSRAVFWLDPSDSSLYRLAVF